MSNRADPRTPSHLDPSVASREAQTSRGELLFILISVGLSLLAILGVVIWKISTLPLEVAPPQEAAMEGPRPLFGFTLTNSAGVRVTRENLRGRWTVANLVCGSCSTTCLRTSAEMAEVQKRIDGRSDVQLLSLTLDPRSDSPVALARFADRVGADTSRWTLLTGDPDTVHGIIQSCFVVEQRSPVSNRPSSWSVQADRLFLIDPDGNVVRSFPGLDPSAHTRILEAIPPVPAPNTAAR
ncbi:MAG TPA: hypothetical protein DCM86_08215 [Verrucomicrobiales bacterium]|nr:hypothetical protein [Verrucomicrobiales bacterium]